MFVVERRYQVADPDSVHEIMNRVRDEFLPMISKAPGFIDYYCFDAREAGRTIITSISIFKDMVGGDESSRMAALWAQRRLSSLVLTPPEITCGEAKVHSGAMVR